VEFILNPIYKIFSHVVSKEMEDLEPILEQLGIYIKKSDYKLDTKPLLKLIFGKFFGNTAPLISSIVQHVPNPQAGTTIKLN